ncbi:MAG: PHP domain-containing protein [Armatimonadetes bacterium]|nr:PHP domain-containing protein [Armatimonadota bacterium]
MTEARIDLHTHTSHSEDRERISLPHGASVTMPFHPTLAPAEAYDLALERGMTHVTFTDHDTISGCLELAERHPRPDRFLFGEEVTCYYQGIPLHVGVFGLTEADHRQLHAGAEHAERETRCLRWNLPELLRYCEDRKLAYELKHPLWARNGLRFSRQQFIDLFEMFPLVEGINGTRHRWLNELGVDLAQRYGRPHVALTAGSDSHTDNIGRCYTITRGETPAEVLASLRAGQARPMGPHGSHRLLEYDTREVIRANVTGRAGQFITLADDQLQELPALATEMLSLVLTGVVAFGVVQEFSRQRSLAREVAELFNAELESGVFDARTLAIADAGRALHGHVRRD